MHASPHSYVLMVTLFLGILFAGLGGAVALSVPQHVQFHSRDSNEHWKDTPYRKEVLYSFLGLGAFFVLSSGVLWWLDRKKQNRIQ